VSDLEAQCEISSTARYLTSFFYSSLLFQRYKLILNCVSSAPTHTVAVLSDKQKPERFAHQVGLL